MKQINWFDRKFSFDTAQNIFPAILERLSGTPIRLEEKCRRLPPDILTVSVEGTWTIKENIGHLIDLEPLWQGRLDDIISGRTHLRPTDLQNRQTSLANHNAVPLEELLQTFRTIRMQTVNLLEQLDEQQVFMAALHPRLQSPMRTMDLFLFVAEHDDHHLARITQLVKVASSQG